MTSWNVLNSKWKLQMVKSIKTRISYKSYSQIEVFNFLSLWSLGKESGGLGEGSETSVVIKNIMFCFWTKSSWPDIFY